MMMVSTVMHCVHALALPQFMNKPIRILVKRDELTLEGIKQVWCVVCDIGVHAHFC
jgi:hypothetical protein